MKSNIFLMILLQILLIALNAVFAAAEIAVLSVNENKLNKLAEDGNRRARRLLKLTKQPAKFLATIQVAITLAGFLGSAFAADNFAGPIVNALMKKGADAYVSESTMNTIAVVVITLILSYVTLIFGELVPKRVAMRKSESLALGISGMLRAVGALFAPLVWLLTKSTNGVLRLMGIDPTQADEQASEEDIRLMVDASAETGAIDREEQSIIQNVFEFDDLTAGEIAAHFDMTKPSVSHHLNILKAADLVSDERSGQNIVYSLNLTVFQELMKWFYDCGFVKGGTDDEKT